jgi:sugar diacid utilization regulator
MTPNEFIKELKKWCDYKFENSAAALDVDDFLNTIKVYAENGFSMRSAATFLKMHPNAILYRFKVIEEATGIKNNNYKFFLDLIFYLRTHYEVRSKASEEGK